jgi:hypothetical protein
MSSANKIFLLEAQGAWPINIGIGIHTGSLMLGIVGESERAQSDIFPMPSISPIASKA